MRLTRQGVRDLDAEQPHVPDWRADVPPIYRCTACGAPGRRLLAGGPRPRPEELPPLPTVGGGGDDVMDATTAALYLAASRYVAWSGGDGSPDDGGALWEALTAALAAFEAAHPEDCEDARAEDAERADGAV